MRLILQDTGLEGVLVFSSDSFRDERGEFRQTYDRQALKGLGVSVDFVEDDIHTGTRNVLRGIHGNDTNWKLVSCLLGEVFFVAVNNDPESSQFRRWMGFRMSVGNRLQALVPPRFGVGEVVLSEKAILHYKQSEAYRPGSQFTIKWNDPVFGILWPIRHPILSERDS